MTKKSKSNMGSKSETSQETEPKPLKSNEVDPGSTNISNQVFDNTSEEEIQSQSEIFFDWFFGLWFFRVLLSKLGLTKYFARPGVRENLVSGLIVSIIAGVAIIGTIRIPSWLDKQEIIQEDRKLNREIQAGFSLEAMKHRQQLASDFAYSIPQSLQLLGKIKSLDSEVFTLLKITDNSANSVEEAEKLLNESTKAIKLAAIETQTDILNAEWRNNKNYLSVCELVGMRFEEVRPYSSSLNSCIDIFTEQDINLSDESTIPEDPSRFIQMAERFYQIRGRIPTDSFFYCNQQPKWITAGFSGTLTDFDELKESDCDCQSNPTFHIKDVIELDLHDPRIEWMKNSNREMELAYKWLRVWYVLDDRDLVCHTKTEFNEYVRKGHTQELAHRNAYDATRRALERASDVLFVETVQNIGIALEDQVAQTSFYSLMEKKPEPSSDPALIP